MIRLATVRALWTALLLMTLATPALALKLELPLKRTAYQDGESIPLAVVRSSAQSPLRDLRVTLQGADGFAVSAQFDPHAELAPGTPARGTEYLKLGAGWLRPGRYTVIVEADGEKAQLELDITSRVQRTTFRLINWGSPSNTEQRLVQGETAFGYNLMYSARGVAADATGDYLRAGVDVMPVCALGGGHQIDLRLDADWSDPYALQGGARRAAKEALIARLRPDGIGVHLYDEPGLTWGTHPETKVFGPHNLPAQTRSYQSALGLTPPAYHTLKPDQPGDAAAWRHFARWKLSFMDAAWRVMQNAVTDVDPNLLALTQSQYGWTAFTDGYYFNVTRSLPITSGHGGYHDIHFGYLTPLYFLEMSRARDRVRPNWYLPTWYSDTSDDLMRLENNLCFATGIQGIMTPPPVEPSVQPASPRQGIVETNQLLARLGTIFHTPRPARTDVALLFSLGDCIAQQMKDPEKLNYADHTRHGRGVMFTWLALRSLQFPVSTVVEEDVLDGTLAANHRAVVVGGLDHLDQPVIDALAQFAQQGGLVYTFDLGLTIPGAIDLNLPTPKLPDADSEEYTKAIASGKAAEYAKYQTPAKYLQGADALRQALSQALSGKQIEPPLRADGGLVLVNQHQLGEVEYLFAINATPVPGALSKIEGTAADTTLSLAADDRPLYDAMRGMAAQGWQRKANRWSKSTRMGLGQMHIIARPRAAIAAVQVETPEVWTDPVREAGPRRVRFAVSIADAKGRLIAGVVPLHVQVISADGSVRHELYRATEAGVLSVELPLAANDVPGQWSVQVRELLGGGEGRAAFALPALKRAGSIAGIHGRAYHHAGDADRVEKFVQRYREVAIVAADEPAAQAAAQRVVEILAPWQVNVRFVPLADAKQPRTLSEEEAATWIGLNHTPKNSIKPNEANSPLQVGFALNGATILVGNAGNHELIRMAADLGVLPYDAKTAGLPGAGRGAVAWQRNVLAPGVETIALIADDEAGFAEAVGTLYEMAAGLRPLTPTLSAAQQTLTPPTAQAKPADLPQPKAITWLNDRVVRLSVADGRVTAITADAVQSTFALKGGKADSKAIDADALKQARTDGGLPKLEPKVWRAHLKPGYYTKAVLEQSAERSAVLYWGGSIILRGGSAGEGKMVKLSGDASAAAWNGDSLVLGLADGQVVTLDW